jgi:hypothetical protein
VSWGRVDSKSGAARGWGALWTRDGGKCITASFKISAQAVVSDIIRCMHTSLLLTLTYQSRVWDVALRHRRVKFNHVPNIWNRLR